MTKQELDRAIVQFERDLERMGETMARERIRERGMVYVKEYTVKAHVRPYRRRTKLRLVA